MECNEYGKYDKYRDMMSFTAGELTEYVMGMGEKPFRAKQMYEWIHKKLVTTWDEMSNISKKLREALQEQYMINPLVIREKLVSSTDGTAKYLMGTADGGIIESVAMQYSYGMSVCISSQVGCRMGCKFCASTLSGLERSLTASEMLAQVYLIQKDMDRRVDNIVVMGIGEPFDNYDELIKFINMVSDKDGLNIGQRGITVSTCGIVENMYRFAEEHMSVTMALSLHAPDDEIRRTIMPVANKYSVQDLIRACRNYVKVTGRRVTIEYAMIEGVNDSEECARKLAGLLRGLMCHVNLIPLNAVKERGTKRSDASSIQDFLRCLDKNGVNVTIRKSMGGDIEAACGQLRRQYEAAM